MLGGRNHWGSPWRLPTTKWQIFSGSGDKLRTIVSTHLLSDKEDSAFSGAQSKKKGSTVSVGCGTSSLVVVEAFMVGKDTMNLWQAPRGMTT